MNSCVVGASVEKVTSGVVSTAAQHTNNERIYLFIQKLSVT
jgi:hypothetical protein